MHEPRIWLAAVAAVLTAATALFVPGMLRGVPVNAQTGGFQTSPVPLPALDTMKIAGDVAVTNSPTVNAQQSGTWIVGLAGAQDVRFVTPSFLSAGKTYVFGLPGGKVETVRVVDIREDGWVQVQSAPGGGPRRWLNPAMAFSVQEGP